MIQGVDVHAGYQKIDWAITAKHVRFCYAKCTTGNSPGVDGQFENNVEGCRANGVPVGSYHYAFCLPPHPDHPGRSPEEEADRHWAAAQGVGAVAGDLPPMVDAEHPAPKDFDDYPGNTERKFGCTRPQVSAWLKAHCEHHTKLWGRKPTIYTYGDYWRWLLSGADMSWASEYEVVFADDYDKYKGPGTPADGVNPSHWSWVSKTWSTWAMWQYSADGSPTRIPGINACPIDRDCMRDDGTLDRWLSWAPTEAPLPTAEIVTNLTESLEELQPTDRT